MLTEDFLEWCDVICAASLFLEVDDFGLQPVHSRRRPEARNVRCSWTTSRKHEECRHDWSFEEIWILGQLQSSVSLNSVSLVYWLVKAGLHVRRKHKHKHKLRVNPRDDASARKRNALRLFLALVLASSRFTLCLCLCLCLCMLASYV